MFSRVEDHVCAKNLPKGAFLLNFSDEEMCANERKKHRNEGFQYVFRGLKEAYFDAFCHISRLEILRAATLPMSYLIVNLLFR